MVVTLIAPTSTGARPGGGLVYGGLPRGGVGCTVPTYVNPPPCESLHPGVGRAAWAAPESIRLPTSSAARVDRIGRRSGEMLIASPRRRLIRAHVAATDDTLVAAQTCLVPGLAVATLVLSICCRRVTKRAHAHA